MTDDLDVLAYLALLAVMSAPRAKKRGGVRRPMQGAGRRGPNPLEPLRRGRLRAEARIVKGGGTVGLVE